MSPKTDDELSSEQYQILRCHGTERPGSSPLNHEKRKGRYYCVACRQALFDSDSKYDSGSGWPSFFAPREDAVDTNRDMSHGMVRVEVTCAHCHGHLGHVFEDGPAPTGLRYCINGAVLEFEPES